MAEMTGLEFFTKAKDIQPDASRILITGVLTLKVVIDAVNKGEIFRFLAKPWMREELIATVRNAVQRFQLLTANNRLSQDALELNEKLAEANAKLQSKVAELTRQKQALDQANHALSRNFSQSLRLVFHIVSTFHPKLGEETKLTVDLVNLMIEHGHFDEKAEHLLRAAAWLRNIGLVRVSRETISRYREAPEELTEEERRMVETHPIYGQTLASFVGGLDEAGEVIRAVHERWDGKGYPDGLGGEAIPTAARYLAVPTFYVETALDRDAALEEILARSGTAFDPEAVRLFLKATRTVQLPHKIREMLLEELQPGMKLAKGIYGQNGLLLVAEGDEINENLLNKIRHHGIVDPITQPLLVYQ